VFEIEKRAGNFDLMIKDASFQNANSIINSEADCLNLTLAGDKVIVLQTKQGINGGNGTSCYPPKSGNGEAGGSGSDASPAICCKGKIRITCAAKVSVRGGAGGNGGRGGDGYGTFSTGGRGGDGGNGAYAIYASAAEVSFADGKDRSYFTATGGLGGIQGSGGSGDSWLFPSLDGNPGLSSPACNVTIKYID
jgi:hypothetical protein